MRAYFIRLQIRVQIVAHIVYIYICNRLYSYASGERHTSRQGEEVRFPFTQTHQQPRANSHHRKVVRLKNFIRMCPFSELPQYIYIYMRDIDIASRNGRRMSTKLCVSIERGADDAFAYSRRSSGAIYQLRTSSHTQEEAL